MMLATVVQTEHRTHAGEDRAVTRVRAIAPPIVERDRLGLTKAERRFDFVDSYGKVSVAAKRARRLIADEMPFRADRALAPYNDHATGVFQVAGDGLAP